ncbi:GNAT family N-acetyltransferase [Kitasatospora sp. NPDC002227]|uniref:GNAT family N-acetyltransferase n=1 Tax=Kitasatospora sp. NPDC002227 TaxID=3154773 RepID=UPI00332C01DE
MTGAPDLLLTERLDLRPVAVEDVAELYRIKSAPETSRYLDSHRFERPEAVREWVERSRLGWEQRGLGYWTVRLRESGEVIGVGGAERRKAFWNVYYRFAPAHWGHGYATELALAARRRAREIDPQALFVAWVHAENAASSVVATRLGLTDFGLREKDHWDGVPMHCFADREPEFD